jgi:hypothetical protein
MSDEKDYPDASYAFYHKLWENAYDALAIAGTGAKRKEVLEIFRKKIIDSEKGLYFGLARKLDREFFGDSHGGLWASAYGFPEVGDVIDNGTLVDCQCYSPGMAIRGARVKSVGLMTMCDEICYGIVGHSGEISWVDDIVDDSDGDVDDVDDDDDVYDVDDDDDADDIVDDVDDDAGDIF